MKGYQKFFLVVGILFAAACVLYVPNYYAASQAQTAFSDGAGLLASGSTAEGTAMVRYSLEMTKLARGSLDTATIVLLRETALDTAKRNPLEPAEPLRLLHDYDVPLSCEQKIGIAKELLLKSEEIAAAGKNDPASRVLYAAALWAQNCGFGDGDAQFKKLAAELKPGDWAQKAALPGSVLDEACVVRTVEQKEIDKTSKISLITKLKDTASALKFGLTRLSAGAKPAPQKPAPEAPPAQPAAAPAPETATATAQATATAPAPKPEKKPAPKVEVKVKKPEPVPAPESAPISPDEKMEKDIVTGTRLKGPAATSASLSPDGKTLNVEFASNSAGEKLQGEIATILGTSYSKAVAGKVRPQTVVLLCRNTSGDKRFTITAGATAVSAFAAKKISPAQFQQSWKTKRFD